MVALTATQERGADLYRILSLEGHPPFLFSGTFPYMTDYIGLHDEYALVPPQTFVDRDRGVDHVLP
jgi:hypothetical protein